MVYSRSVLFVVAVVVGNSEQGTMDRVRSGRVGAECRVQSAGWKAVAHQNEADGCRSGLKAVAVDYLI